MQQGAQRNGKAGREGIGCGDRFGCAGQRSDHGGIGVIRLNFRQQPLDNGDGGFTAAERIAAERGCPGAVAIFRNQLGDAQGERQVINLRQAHRTGAQEIVLTDRLARC